MLWKYLKFNRPETGEAYEKANTHTMVLVIAGISYDLSHHHHISRFFITGGLRHTYVLALPFNTLIAIVLAS